LSVVLDPCGIGKDRKIVMLVYVWLSWAAGVVAEVLVEVLVPVVTVSLVIRPSGMLGAAGPARRLRWL
jgi:hypothetical protein